MYVIVTGDWKYNWNCYVGSITERISSNYWNLTIPLNIISLNSCTVTSNIYLKCSLAMKFRSSRKGKQKSPGRAASRSRSQPPTPGGRENVTQINMA